MLYKTIILGLLEQRPQMYEQLRKEHKLLVTVYHLAMELKESHDAWKEILRGAEPGSPEQIASQALEMAVKELEDGLPQM